MAAEEYLYSLGIDTQDADRALDQIISIVAAASEQFESLSKRLDKADAALNGVASSQKKQSAAQREETKEVSEGTKAWRAYAKQLADAQAAYKNFRKGDISGVTDSPAKDVSGYSKGQLEELIAIDEAANASIIAAARRRVSTLNSIEEGRAAVQEARSNATTAREIRNLSQIEAAERKYVAARTALTAAQNEVRAAGAAGDEERLAAALREQVTAINTNAAAYRDLSNIRERDARVAREAADSAVASIQRESAARSAAYSQAVQQATALDRSLVSQARSSIGSSDARIGAAWEANDRDEQIAERGRLAVATDELAAANRRLATSEAALARAQDSGDIHQQERAYRDLADATEGARAANLEFARATDEANRAADQLTGNLPRLRYAIYDVSNAIGVGSAAMLAGVAASAAVGIAWERDFAQVQRTSGATGVELGNLRDSFTELAQTVPEAYSELASIGTLGGQLNIPNGQLADFTEEVAMFSSTTNVSVEESATAFGRLDALLPDVGGQYDRLGSSILQVGVNSVATEGEIIGITSQISAAGAQAGLTSDEVIGLAAAFGSVGIPAESSRGTVLRFFSQINGALSGSNGMLQDFAQVSNKTVGEFQRDWAADKSAAIVDILEGIGSRGVGAEGALKALGITAQRDLSNLLKLSQNGQLVADAFREAEAGFEDGNVVADQYGITSETVAAKLQLLVNNVEALVATLSAASTGPLKFFIDSLNNMLRGLTDLAENPVLQWVIAIGGGLTALAATIGVGIALILRFYAASLAMRTGLAEAAAAGAIAEGRLSRLAVTYGLLTEAQVASSVATRANNAALAQSTTASGTATAGAGRLTRALGAAGLVGSLIALIPAIGSWASEMVSASAQSELGIDNVDAAVKRLLANKPELDAMIADVGTIGANNNQFDPNPFAARGITSATAYDNAKGLTDIGLGGISGAEASLDLFQQKLDVIQATLLETFKSGNTAGAQQDYMALRLELDDMGFSQEKINSLLSPYTTGIAEAGGASGVASDQLAELNSQMLEHLGALQSEVDAQLAVTNSLYGLGQSLYENGDAFGYYSAEGRANTAALQGTINSYVQAFGNDAQQLANNLQSLYTYILQNTSAPASALAQLQAAISATGRKPAGAGSSSLPITPLMDGYTASANKAAQAAQKSTNAIREQIVTLEDYANDLRGVFDRAFDLRFGNEEAFDQIQSGWNSIAKSIEDVNRQIADYQAEMGLLTADRAVREYWLSVAENYGDALRAGELRAELADIDNKLKKTSDELTKAQEQNSKTVEGNSDAAVANRAEILGLVSSYEDYIAQLASSGMSQQELQAKSAQLKEEFIRQALQLGYSRDAVDKYARAFDDVSTAISRVPRNVTVEANADPALQALNEFVAKARDIAANSGISVPISTTSDNSGAADNLRSVMNAYKAQLDAFYASNGGNQNLYSQRLEAAIRRIRDQLAGMGYKTGGWTGNGSTNDIAGVVHGREYVLNATGAQMFPRQVLDAANQGRQTYAPAMRMPSMPSSFGGGMDSSREVVGLLRQIAANSGIFLPGDALAGAVAGSQVNGANRRRY